MRYRFVTFDVNDTLVKVRGSVGDVYSKIAALYGIELNPSVANQHFKKNWGLMHKEHPNFGRNTSLGWENWWKNIVAFTIKDSNKNETPDEGKLEQIATHLNDLFATKDGWELVDGAHGLLEALSSRDVRLGIISNFDPRLNSVLKELGINNYFQFTITSYEANVMKPDVKIFRMAEKAFVSEGLTDLNRRSFIHVGNDPEKDIAGAIGAGWSAALFTNKEIKSTHWDVTTFNNFNHLQKHLLS